MLPEWRDRGLPPQGGSCLRLGVCRGFGGAIRGVEVPSIAGCIDGSPHDVHRGRTSRARRARMVTPVRTCSQTRTTKSKDTDTQHSRAGPVIPSSRFWQGRPGNDYNGWPHRDRSGRRRRAAFRSSGEAFVIRTRIGSRAVRRCAWVGGGRGLLSVRGRGGAGAPVRPPRPVPVPARGEPGGAGVGTGGDVPPARRPRAHSANPMSPKTSSAATPRSTHINGDVGEAGKVCAFCRYSCANWWLGTTCRTAF